MYRIFRERTLPDIVPFNVCGACGSIARTHQRVLSKNVCLFSFVLLCGCKFLCIDGEINICYVLSTFGI